MPLWTEEEETEGSYSTLPEGEYVCVLDNCEVDTTKDPHVVSLRWNVTGGEHKGSKLFQNFRFNEKSKKFLMWQLGTLDLGSYVRDADSWDQGAIDCADILFKAVGKIGCMGTVKHREYQGKTYTDFIVDEKYTASQLSKVNEGVVNHAPVPTLPDEELPF